MNENIESVYCEICTGCGESGCCPADICEMNENGKYCKTYLNDLHFAYYMYKDIYSLVCDDPKYKEIFDKNYKLVYGR